MIQIKKHICNYHIKILWIELFIWNDPKDGSWGFFDGDGAFCIDLGQIRVYPF